ncbi:MAG: Bug family tripartite tricarboxylate transporter substrate binding protein [Rhodospirillales bacterium]
MRSKIFKSLSIGLMAGAGALAVSALSVPGTAVAAYPEKPITVVVGWGPGGGIDRYMRVVQSYSKKYLGVKMRLVYKPGGGGTVAHNLLVRNLPKNGYTLGAANIPHQTIPTQISKKGYRLKDIQWVATFSLVPSVVIVKRDSPYKTLADLVKAAKKEPGRLKAGSPGARSGSAAFHYKWTKLAGANITLVPYRGGAKMYKGLLGGEIEVMATNMNWGVKFKDTVLTLATASEKRDPLNTEAPTFRELGIDYIDYLSRSLTASAKVSKKKIDTLGKLFRKMAANKDFQKDLAKKAGINTVYMNGDETAKYVANYVKNSESVFALMRSKMKK